MINPASFNHPDDYAKAFTSAHPGYFPTYFSSLQASWLITRETEKAVQIDHEHWFPKSQVLIEDGRISGVKNNWYQKIKRGASRNFGF